MSQAFIRICAAVGVMLLSLLSFNLAFAQETSVASLANGEVPPATPARSEPVSPSEAATILARFVEAERKVRDALNQHTFKRDVVLQTIGPSGEVTGEYIRNSRFVFDDRGRRIERVLFHPESTIREMRITKEDIQDLAGAQLLGIDIVETTKYKLTFAGTEIVGLRQLFVVDVTPLITPDPNHMSERFFVGRVWIDPINLQIVKVRGIVEPQGKQRFPLFETWREPIKDGLAFPIRTEADDVLHFPKRDVHYRIKVRYYDYQLFRSKVSIKEIDEAAPNVNEASLKKDDSAKRKEAFPRIADNSPGQPSLPGVDPRKKTQTCKTNRDAPPVGPYHWPADSNVKVYFVRDMFTANQRAALLDAMAVWTLVSQEIGSGVKFTDAGETESRMSCRGCLTIRRRDVYKQDKHHYAFFYPMSEEEGRLLVSAWIDLDFGITNPKALAGFMAHELAHGLGLWDCTTCGKKRSLMNGFPGINKDNGLFAPSRCDLATVRQVYQEERLAEAGRSNGSKGRWAENASRLTLANLEKANFFLPLNLQRPLIGGAAAYVGDKQLGAVSAKGIFVLPPLSSDKSGFSQIYLRRHHIDNSVFFPPGPSEPVIGDPK